MKNVVVVDIDTEREESLMIGKAEDFVVPETVDETLRAVTLDISTLVCGIKFLINSHMETKLANSILDNILTDLNDFKTELNQIDEAQKDE